MICGGYGTGLGALTATRPKYLVPVLGKPFADWQIELLVSQGFDEFVFAIGHMGEQIRAHIDYHWRDLDATFSDHPPRSTWDAYNRAKVRGRHAVLYGDSYLALAPARVKEWWDRPENVYVRWASEDYGMRFLGGRGRLQVEAPMRYQEVGTPEGITRLEVWLEAQ